MDFNSELLKSWENEWGNLDDKQKLIQLGKLKMLEEISMMMDMYRESLTRELKINHCETEQDVLDGKKIEPNKEYKDPELVEVKNL
jgi:hypothetical protein